MKPTVVRPASKSKIIKARVLPFSPGSQWGVSFEFENGSSCSHYQLSEKEANRQAKRVGEIEEFPQLVAVGPLYEPRNGLVPTAEESSPEKKLDRALEGS